VEVHDRGRNVLEHLVERRLIEVDDELARDGQR